MILRNFRALLIGGVAMLTLSSSVHSQSLRATTVTTRPSLSKAQLSSLVSSRSANTLSLVAVTHSGSAQVLRGNPAEAQPLIAGFDRQNAAVIEQTATTYLQNSVLPMLQISSGVSITPLATIETGNSWHSNFQASFNGIPLRDRSMHVHIGADNGKVILIRSNVPNSEPNVAAPSFDAATALSVAAKAYTNEYGSTYSLTESPSLIYACFPGPDDITLAYETILSDGFHQWRYTIDATTGEILQKLDMIVCNFGTEPVGSPTILTAEEPIVKDHDPLAITNTPLESVTGRVLAKVHLKKPTDTLTTVGLGGVNVTVNGSTLITDSNGVWSTETTYPVTLTTQFAGPYFRVLRQDGGSNGKITKTFDSGPVDVLWDDSNSDPAERDVANSINIARRHINVIDPKLTKINNRVNVNINIDNSCNAFFDASSNSLNFFIKSGGCNNTAMIPDVVEHEFGHRVNLMRYQAAGKQGMVDRGLDEGFADLSSNLLRNDPIIGYGFFSSGNNTLRNSNNTKTWPKNIDPDGHITGMIISGAVWDLVKSIGLSTAENLFTKAQYLAPDGNGYNDPGSMEEAFVDVLHAFLLSDDDNNNLADGTPHAEQILKAFQLHNVGIQNYFDMNVIPVADADALAPSYPVQATIKYNGPVGGINPDSVVVYYSTDKGASYKSALLQKTSGDTYTGAIPKAPAQTAVRYYLSAGTTFTTAGNAVFPMYKSEPYYFLVGYSSKMLDNCEDETGWQFALDSEKGKGFWTMDVPYGTLVSGSAEYVQQDSDHSVTGTGRCLITGNQNTQNALADAITGGTKTLITPEYSLSGLSDPVVRFWYYFSNDAGTNAGGPVWKTYYSTNGTSWKSLQNTTLSTKGWKPYVLRLKDVGASTATKIMLRFVPSDAVTPQVYPQQNPRAGTIVEAGVDDIEIFDAAAPVDKVMTAPLASMAVYPNPAFRGKHLTVSGLTFKGDAVIRYTLYNNLGQVIISSSSAMTDDRYTMAVPASISAGVYQIALTDGEQTVTKELLIQ